MPNIMEICDITYKEPEGPTKVNTDPAATVESAMEVQPTVIEAKADTDPAATGKSGMEVQPTVLDSSEGSCLKIGADMPRPTVCKRTTTEVGELLPPHENMLNYLANSKTAFFKSQQADEPELDFNQKRQIACDVLAKSPGQFLARFGQHIQPIHLDYFVDVPTKTTDYEVAFRVKQLSRFHCKTKRQLDVRNRRYVAMKKLIAESTYFSELEMKKRNPLLYEELVGKYLTQKEIEEQERHSFVAENATLVDTLLNQIERDQIKALRESQLQAEEEAREEVDTSDEDEEDEVDEDDDEDDKDSAENESMEEDEEMDNTEDESKGRPGRKKIPRLSSGEKGFWHGEFFNRMCDSFLEGKDMDFNYSEVDDNLEYDNITDRALDEEEKYFDSETPDTAVASTVNSDAEDELDIFMKNLAPDPSPHELSDRLERM